LIRRFLRRVLGPRRARPGLDLSEPWKIPQSPVTPEDVFYCFRLLLGRPPNREEWEGHVGQAPADLDALVRSYMSSLEFSRRADTVLGRRLDDRLSLVSAKGFSIYVQEDDTSVGQHVKRGGYEPHVTAVFRDRLRPGMHVLDIGANIGYYTMLAASLDRGRTEPGEREAAGGKPACQLFRQRDSCPGGGGARARPPRTPRLVRQRDDVGHPA
jgi:hypothetical protein